MNNIYTIVIIGGGNIGSRHAQSLALLTVPTNLVVIDANQQSLDVCKSRLEGLAMDWNKVSVSYFTSIEALPAKVDLAIIATGSSSRLNLMQSLFARCECRCLILEKFLFSSLHEYELASALIEQQKNTLVYVNCMKRVFEAYQWVLKKLNAAEGELNMVVSGKNWGLAGNSVHYMDLFGLGTGKNIRHCEIANSPDSKIIESKRLDYIEVIGKCTVLTDGNDRLEMTSSEGEDSPVQISFKKNDLHLTVIETGDKIEIEYQNEKVIFNYPFQSQLTITYFNELIHTGKIPLPGFMESSVQHQAFLKAMEEFVKQKKYDKTWKIT